MTRILADLPDEDIAWLDQLANEQGKSRASVLREAVAAYRADAPKDWLEAGFGAWKSRTDIGDAVDWQRRERASWTRPRGGFFSWLTMPEGANSRELARLGMEQGVAVVPGVPFYPDGRGTREVRLSFSKVADGDIEEGVRRLGTVLHRAA